jgi:hypothetical protein
MTAETQRDQLDAALRLVRQFVPAATRVYVTTSDQDLYGFALVDVMTTLGTRLSATAPRLLVNLIDDTHQYLGDLDWDGLVGEDAGGRAVLDLPDTPVPDKPFWTCLTCGESSQALTGDRDAVHLRHDGAHYPNWCTDEEMGFTRA